MQQMQVKVDAYEREMVELKENKSCPKNIVVVRCNHKGEISGE